MAKGQVAGNLAEPDSKKGNGRAMKTQEDSNGTNDQDLKACTTKTPSCTGQAGSGKATERCCGNAGKTCSCEICTGKATKPCTSKTPGSCTGKAGTGKVTASCTSR